MSIRIRSKAPAAPVAPRSVARVADTLLPPRPARDPERLRGPLPAGVLARCKDKQAAQPADAAPSTPATPATAAGGTRKGRGGGQQQQAAKPKQSAPPPKPKAAPPKKLTADDKWEALTGALARFELARDELIAAKPAEADIGKLYTAFNNTLNGAKESTLKKVGAWLKRTQTGTRDIANRMEYAKAYFDIRRSHQTDVLGQENKENLTARATAAASDEFDKLDLDKCFEDDLKSVRDLGPASQLGEGLSPASSVDDLLANLQSMQHIPVGHEVAEAYHSHKHQKEMPQAEQAAKPAGSPHFAPGSTAGPYQASARKLLDKKLLVSEKAMPNGSRELIFERKTGQPVAEVVQLVVYVWKDAKTNETGASIATYGRRGLTKEEDKALKEHKKSAAAPPPTSAAAAAAPPPDTPPASAAPPASDTPQATPVGAGSEQQ